MSSFKPPVLKKRLPLTIPIFVLLLLGGVFTARAADPKKGETLFKNNCATCHALDYKVTGPALKGIDSRRTEQWLLSWIMNNKKFRDSGDKGAISVYNENNQATMTIFEGILTNDDIKDILAYIKDASTATATPGAGGAAAGAAAPSDSSSSLLTIGGLLIVIVVLFLVIAILNRVIKTLDRIVLRTKNAPLSSSLSSALGHDEDMLAEAEDHRAPKKDIFRGIKRLAQSKQAVVLVLSLTSVSLVYLYWAQMLSIGITQGYQPVQPINFSHALHAGSMKISCQYCHGGAFKSKNAGIPTANICMNCHAAAQLREKYNGKVSPEIAKIYKALDYNPDTKQYGSNKRPIQWVKIHQLQDFVYFNHSQHVSVGGQACQNCHGPIQTMKQVYQYSPMTMAWCINCHRTTKVNSKGNAYYDKMLAMHNEFKKGEKVTVAMMGGIECAKCHY